MALTRAKLEELIGNGDIDVGGGGFNPNILHNWDFTNPINQRGLATASGTGYWLDRWRMIRTTGATYTYSNVWGLRGITTTDDIIMRQYIENPNAYAGKTVTVSVEVYSASVTADSTIRLQHNVSTNIGTYAISNGDTGIKSFTATIPNTELTDLSVAFYNFGGNDVRIKRIKLELGTVSTLHLDPPVDHAIELPKCLRFYWKIQQRIALPGWRYSGNVQLCLFLPQVMRINPSLSFDAINNVMWSGGGGSNYSIISSELGGNYLYLSVSPGSAPSNQGCTGVLLEGYLSADL